MPGTYRCPAETGFYFLQSRYYDPETGRFLNADSQLNANDINGYNMFSYCANNPVNNIDPDGHSWKSFKKWCSNTYKKLKKAAQKVNKTITKTVKTIGAAILSFDIKAGVGTGLRGSVKMAGAEISAGGKADLLTGKLTYNSIDIGQECLVGVSVGVQSIDEISIELEQMQYESFITQEVVTNHLSPDISIDLLGIDFYLIIGGTASISFNFSTFEKFVIDIWG